MTIFNANFTPPKIELIIIEKRKWNKGKYYYILREDGKEYNIIGKKHKYDNKKNIIKIYPIDKEKLYIILEIKKENLIDNSKKCQ